MRSIFMATGLVALVALASVAGCSKEQNKGQEQGQQQQPSQGQQPQQKKAEEQPKAGEAAAIPEESRKLYGERCASCHGADGDGTGAAAAALPVKPRNYHDMEWQKATTDEQIREIIIKGGAGVGKSPLMPPNPDLADKPEVVNGLVALIRSFGKQ